jgi:transposase
VDNDLIHFKMARGKAICEEIRNLIISKRNDGKTIREISKDLNIPKSSVQNIIKINKLRNSTDVLKKTGRKTKFTDRDTRALKTILVKNRRETVRGISQMWTKKMGKSVSRETTRRWIHKLEFGFYKVDLYVNFVILNVN